MICISCKTRTDQINTIQIEVEQIVTQHTFVSEEVKPDYDTTRWSEFANDSIYNLEIRYATEDNFMKQKIYDCDRCFLRPNVAEKFQAASEELYALGYTIILYDCYRPRPYQQKLWDIMPNAMYVTPPKKGSMHNRGHAIDMGLVDADTGEIIDMGSDYDYFGKEAHYAYPNLSDEIKNRRYLLRKTMEKYGFSGIRTEWWHFSYKRDLYGFDDWLWECG